MPRVSDFAVDQAASASPMLQRFYLAGGGSSKDFLTDLRAALNVAIVLMRPEMRKAWRSDYDGPERRYTGPERRT